MAFKGQKKTKPEQQPEQPQTKKRFGSGKQTTKENGNNSDIVFAKGINIYYPHQNAPDFVKANLVISLDTLIEWCEANQDKLYNSDRYGAQLKFSINESKGGALYMKVDTFGTEYDKG